MGAIGEALIPLMEKLTELVTWFSTLDGWIKGVILTILAIVAAIGPLLMIIGQMSIGITALTGFFAADGIAVALWSGICGIATAVTTALGAAIAFLTGPIGLVILAVAAVIAIGVLLYKNWETVKEVAFSVFGAIGDFIGGICDNIGGFFKGMINGVIWGLNQMIGALNSLSFDLPDFLGGGEIGFDIPDIPSFAVGTRYLPKDMLIQAHKGEMIVPKNGKSICQ